MEPPKGLAPRLPSPVPLHSTTLPPTPEAAGYLGGRAVRSAGADDSQPPPRPADSAVPWKATSLPQRNPKRKREEAPLPTPRERVEQERLALARLDLRDELRAYAACGNDLAQEPVAAQMRLIGRSLASHAPGRIAPVLALVGHQYTGNYASETEVRRLTTLMRAYAQARDRDTGARGLAQEIGTLLHHGLAEHLGEIRSDLGAFHAFTRAWLDLYRDPPKTPVPQAGLPGIAEALASLHRGSKIDAGDFAHCIDIERLMVPGSAEANRQRLAQLLNSELSWHVKGELAHRFAYIKFAGEQWASNAAISLSVTTDRLGIRHELEECHRQLGNGGPMKVLALASGSNDIDEDLARCVQAAVEHLSTAQRIVCARAIALSSNWTYVDDHWSISGLVRSVEDLDARAGVLTMSCLAAAHSGRDPLIRHLRPGVGNATAFAEAMATRLRTDDEDDCYNCPLDGDNLRHAELGIRMVNDPLAVFEPIAPDPDGGLDDEPAAASQETAKAFALSVLDDFYAIPGVFEPDRNESGARSARAHLESLWTDARITDAPTRAAVALRLFKGAGHLLTPEDFLRTLDRAERALPKLAPEEPLRPREADQASGAFSQLEPLFAHSAWQLEIHQTLPRLFGLEDLLSEGTPAPGSVQARAPEIRQMLEFVGEQTKRLALLSSLASTTPSADRYASLAKENRGRQHAAVKQLNEYQTRLEQLGQMLSSVPDRSSSSSSSSAAAPDGRGDAKPSPGSRTVLAEAAMPAASFAPGSKPTGRES